MSGAATNSQLRAIRLPEADGVEVLALTLAVALDREAAPEVAA